MKLGTLLVLCLFVAACGEKATTGSTTPDPSGEPTDDSSSEGSGALVAKPTSWEMKNGHELVLPAIGFESGTDRLLPDAEAGLVSIQAYLEAKPAITLLRIESHLERTGEMEEGLELTARRALAVTSWLVARGIDCKRLVPVAYAATKPAYGDARDTRIEAVNAALRDRPIGGMPVEGQGQVAGDPCD